MVTADFCKDFLSLDGLGLAIVLFSLLHLSFVRIMFRLLIHQVETNPLMSGVISNGSHPRPMLAHDWMLSI